MYQLIVFQFFQVDDGNSQLSGPVPGGGVAQLGGDDGGLGALAAEPIPQNGEFVECFGLDMESELFMGLSLGDIVYNIMLHPDEAICALLELFYSNETGDFYKRDPYTYPIENINYHETTLLNKTINPTLTYGTDVKYSKYLKKMALKLSL